MATCKTCGEDYHACSNCGLTQLEREYCGHCIDAVLLDFKTRSELFAKTLTHEQCKTYLELYLHNDQYYWLDTAIENRLKELDS